MSDYITSILKTKGNAIWSVAPDATVFEAIARMAEKGIGALLVMSEQKLVGIVSERDYARKVILQGRSSKDTRVDEIMTSHLITVTPEYTIDDCMRLMTQHRIRHLPVTDCDSVVGMLSIGDLVNAIISAQAQTIDHLHTYIGVKYPA
jgi:CBS domain-containing protein